MREPARLGPAFRFRPARWAGTCEHLTGRVSESRAELTHERADGVCPERSGRSPTGKSRRPAQRVPGAYLRGRGTVAREREHGSPIFGEARITGRPAVTWRGTAVVPMAICAAALVGLNQL